MKLIFSICLLFLSLSSYSQHRSIFNRTPYRDIEDDPSLNIQGYVTTDTTTGVALICEDWNIPTLKYVKVTVISTTVVEANNNIRSNSEFWYTPYKTESGVAFHTKLSINQILQFFEKQ